jgi:pyruvate dehydrogenase E1 component beta subunit
MPRISISESIRAAMAEEMRRDPSVVLWGLDVGPYGGAFGCSKGLSAEFGAERVVDMPIAEAGYVGAGVGAAMTGLRPIVELQFSDWITLASDMLVNQAANMRYMFGGSYTVPLVLRGPCGGYISAAAQHSHMFESWFSFVPGLKVVLPSTPADAKGLLKSAIRDDNPVIFFEHKKLYAFKGEVPEDSETLIPLGKADIKRPGSDVSIVTYGYAVHLALEAAKLLAGEGIEAEIVDLRTIKPMDAETILASVRKTGRLVALQETWLSCSVASEVAALVAEKAFRALKSPILRVGSADAPVPFSPVLEKAVLPQIDDILRAVHAVMR